MKIKAIARTESGAVMLIIDEYESSEYAQAELESKGYKVLSLSVSDENEYQITI